MLSTALGRQIRINEVERLTQRGRRNLLLRCLTDPAPNLPSSFILKKIETKVYNPEDTASWETMRFFKDWVGAQFLSTISRRSNHSPHCYGGDRKLGFSMLEDLGTHSSLVEPLLAKDSNQAEKTLLKYATRLGQMHSDTIGRAAEFEALFHSISPTAQMSSLHMTSQAARLPIQAANGLNQCLQNLQARLESLGIQAESGLAQELASIVDAITNPGPFLAYVHADPCPDNEFDTGEELRLIDFEFGHFGHALIDAAYPRMIFPTCWCAGRLPHSIISQMETLYRTELSRGCPEAQDDSLFETALVKICGFCLLSTLIRHLEDALKRDRNWGIATVRQRVIARLEAFIDTSEQFAQLPRLRGMSSNLLELLRQRWPNTPQLPLYPAFRDR
ncbi:phosphotransferase [Leptolyngbya sp. FACHB-261]|nr:phosphotransferase [Leptolyngbya sp. FACHB-261]